ncbi:MAG: tetratricopeptide repeat protein [Methylocystis sp.]|uniref:tetratricopeptide repeat protein n=1 Tax=Methylocystis sp. TaxID=1911079 RepID=UPI003DA2BED3
MSFLSGLCVMLLILGARLSGAEAQTSAPTFVSSAACASCHNSEHSDWLASQHYAAMQEPKESAVLGRFDGAVFRKGGVETVFFERDAKYFIRSEGSDGATADFEVRYVFGVYPLQQYLLELPGGRLQAFGVAWDARPASEGGQRWFDLYPDRKLAAGDPLHWTGIDQNWNYQCAWCHSTNLRKNYDANANAYATTFSELSVGCEACHGPASRHVAWAGKPSPPPPHYGFDVGFDQRAGVSWQAGAGATATRSGPPTSDREARVCAGCHARRQQFSDDPVAAARFYDAFRPVTLEAGLYHPDGQQRDEVYNFGSFLQSRMHAAGVTCSDCHNPHSGKLRLAGNALCGQCHSPRVFDQASHHHHAADSQGAQCVNCHMPVTVYMGVDARRDHSMRIPRPDRTAAMATPNACNQCHDEKSAAWAMESVSSWGMGGKPGAQGFAEAFHLADSGAPGAGRALARIVEDRTQSVIARASALHRLSQSPTVGTLSLASDALSDPDPMVRSAAAAVLSGADAATKRKALIPLLSDEARALRMEAARALVGEAEADLEPAARRAFEKALAEYEAGQLFNAERPESQANLGAFHLARGKIEAARAAYETALALDRSFAPAAISLAEIARASGDEKAAEATLRRSLAQNPNSGPLAHALGLSLVRQKRLPEAMESLGKAVALSPDDARFAYVFGVAQHDTGAPDKARETLSAALSRHPFDHDILTTLTTYEMEAGDIAGAAGHAERLSQLAPEDDEIRRFIAAVRDMAARARR